jgi:thiosulfate/3-mercaptopyruvate sulfurtransferase
VFVHNEETTMSLPTNPGNRHPELLVEPDWLWEHRDDPGVRLIDCARIEAYWRAHIPGAVGLPVDGRIKEPEGGVHVMGAEKFAELMSELGVSADTTVVTYDDFNTTWATRLWWVLAYYGHRDARVLNGGWVRWLAESRPLSREEIEPDRGRFTARPNEDVMCRLDYLKGRYDDPDVQVLNVLPEAYYSGEENPFENRRPGHIPGSVNIPVEEFLAEDKHGVFKTAGELEAILEKHGLSPERETIVHCQCGRWTTLGFFVLKLLGWDRVRAYDAAMAEWANRDDTPLTLGSV